MKISKFINILLGLLFVVVLLILGYRPDIGGLVDKFSFIPMYKPAEKPKIECSLISYPDQYKEGLSYDGVVWKDGYKEYKLIISNASKKTEPSDLRFYISMPTAVVSVKQLNCVGMLNPVVQIEEEKIRNIVDGKATKLFPVSSSDFRINIDKAYPDSYITLRIILEFADVGHGDEGYISIKYRYQSAKGHEESESVEYPIVFRNKGEKTLQIDQSRKLKSDRMINELWLFPEQSR
jgi:hypothetical protein